MSPSADSSRSGRNGANKRSEIPQESACHRCSSVADSSLNRLFRRPLGAIHAGTLSSPGDIVRSRRAEESARKGPAATRQCPEIPQGANQASKKTARPCRFTRIIGVSRRWREPRWENATDADRIMMTAELGSASEGQAAENLHNPRFFGRRGLRPALGFPVPQSITCRKCHCRIAARRKQGVRPFLVHCSRCGSSTQVRPWRARLVMAAWLVLGVALVFTLIAVAAHQQAERLWVAP